jgi:hypothetical protein
MIFERYCVDGSHRQFSLGVFPIHPAPKSRPWPVERETRLERHPRNQRAAIGSGILAYLLGPSVDSALMRHKATLPLLLLLLVAGQMSAEFCAAQCQNMRMAEPTCAMHKMAHSHCASCKHAFADSRNASLSTPRTCSGQTCTRALELVKVRTDPEVKPLVAAISFDVLAPPLLEDTHRARFRDA